jgi:glycosyltransferase involved in cell wall biosynthesis
VGFDAVTTNPRAELPPGVGLVSASSFGMDARPASYDAIVYAIGNSAGHLATVELALRYPGWLWLHEVRLPGLATTALEALDDPGFESAVAGLLTRAYPGRPPLGAARKAGRSNLALIAAGVGLVAPLVERCRGILVNSTIALRLLELDLPPLAHHPPIHVLPPGCPPVRPRRQQAARDREPDGPLVVALGMVSMAKRPDALVDAVAQAGCRLAFVGPCPPILVQVVTERARTRGIEDRVHVVGEVDGPGWQEWLDRASLAVQLRGSSSGETSAAILEALACGVPVLTNMGSAAEYPDGTVAHVASLEGGVLGARIEALMSSPGDLHDLSEAGQAFAAAHPFDRLAEALIAAIGAGA